MSIAGQEKSRTLRDKIKVRATVDAVTFSTGTTVITFIDNMPPSDIIAVFNGFLLYDLDTELFASDKHGWVEHEKDLIIHVDHAYVSWGENELWGKDLDAAHPLLNGQRILSLLKKGDEVVLVPCKSHESIVGEVLFIYQEFNWQCAFGIKSRSGKLPIKYS